MGKTLVVVESPAKAKTIKKYLGSKYEVMASKGHNKDLPKKLGVDVDHGFKETYEIIVGKEKIVDELKAAGREVRRDPPRSRPRTVRGRPSPGTSPRSSGRSGASGSSSTRSPSRVSPRASPALGP